MKIVFVGNGTLMSDAYPAPNVGGSVQVWGLSKELAKRGYEIYIIRRARLNEITCADGVKIVGISFNSIDARTPHFSYPYFMGALFSQLYFSRKAMNLIKHIKPDIICLIDRFSGLFPSYLNVAKVYTVHVAEALNFHKSYSIYANKLNSIMFSVKKLFENKILHNVDKIVVLNTFIKKYLERIGYENVCKIPNGIDIPQFSHITDNNFILYAGRFDWNKNVCSLVNVFTQIHKLYPSYYLYLVGSGPEEKRIISLVREKGVCSKVKIVPWLPRNKVMELMSRCSIFVLPSFFEVCPVVVLEAMASAKPVIARANMGTVDIITHGENGYLYNNDGELRAYLEKLLSDDNLRKKIGYNARCIVEREYTFSKIADKYEELFYKLLTKYKNLT